MNARDDSALGRFWAEALGWVISSEEPGVTNLEQEGFAYPHPSVVCIDMRATSSTSFPRADAKAALAQRSWLSLRVRRVYLHR
jgi:hypothetical protein